MKDIKELIYAAVEENALKFQELVNNQLQVRAYEAIESLRPEIGASMFGEAKKMEDDEEEMEDEEDEDEDEDEDEKKSKVEEELKGKQHKIDKNKNGKIDAHDFKLLRQEEVEQIDEIGDTPAGRAALGKLASQRFGRARWAAGVHRATSRSDGGASPHSRLQDKDSEVGKKAADKAGIAHRDVPDHNYDFDKKGGVGTKVADPAHKLADRNKPKPKMEEVEQVNERSREELISQIKGLKKPAIKHGFDWPSNDSTDKTSTRDLKSFHKSARSVIKQGLKAKAKAKADVQEVAMPQNAADWQALITHQVKTTGHPVATDAQFRATHGKDKTKIASLEPGEDKLHYATAQGGTVKQ